MLEVDAQLEPEEEAESDSFSAYEECLDDFLKSQERKVPSLNPKPQPNWTSQHKH